DRLGRDIFSRILHGAGNSFAMTFLMVAVISVTGTFIGLTCGYFEGAFDTCVMRAADILLAFPETVFAIAVAGMLGPGLLNTVLALSLIGWTRYARMTRSLTTSVKKRGYVIQARFSGASTAKILFKYILPNVAPQLVVMAAMSVGSTMLSLASLSFLGLASQPPTAEWGFMIYESRQYMQIAPWMMIYPGLALLLTVVVFNLLGDALRDFMDIKM
ncbi:MAG: ABC transporter permease, partial [Clostridia bacterium]|nr:ABC transporter permease [Clostridia bacterium]